jgi:hypothetical protein
VTRRKNQNDGYCDEEGTDGQNNKWREHKDTILEVDEN